MSPDAPPTPPQTPDAIPRPTPGEVVRPAHRPLDRVPGERYAASAETAPSPSGSVLLVVVGAVLPAAIGCGLLVLFASPLAVTEPLVIVAFLLGLGTGFGARRGGGSRVPVPRRRAVAIVAALGAVVVADLVVWQLALGEGGVLPLLDYEWLVFGPTAVLGPIAAGLAAWATA